MKTLLLFVTLVWAVEADPRDKEIQKDLEFFESFEVLEAMPLLTDFGPVLDAIKKDEADGDAVVKEPK